MNEDQSQQDGAEMAETSPETLDHASAGRQYHRLDSLLMSLQRGLASTTAGTIQAARPKPDSPGNSSEKPAALSPEEKRHAAGLMRINHAGEIAAQALYHGQAATARNPETRAMMEEAAEEEGDHLAWCEQRLDELGEKPSQLAPLWYAGSWAIGAAAGLSGDKNSLGFVAETERQVSEHLQDHLNRLPEADTASRAVISQMKADEEAHGSAAVEAGAAPLPPPVRGLMGAAAMVMKKLAYKI